MTVAEVPAAAVEVAAVPVPAAGELEVASAQERARARQMVRWEWGSSNHHSPLLPTPVQLLSLHARAHYARRLLYRFIRVEYEIEPFTLLGSILLSSCSRFGSRVRVQ
jgi:hypothetical protein